MEYRKVGKTDIEVSVVAMGCGTIGGNDFRGQQAERDAVAAIETALDAGINLFDTAETYAKGGSELLLGKVLSQRRHEVVISTKISPLNLKAEDVGPACEASLKRLETDYIDLYHIHWRNREIPLAETMTALEKLKQQGKIRAICVSNFGVDDMAELLEVGRCEVNQMPYNLLGRAIEYQVQPRCVQNKIGILCYSPLMHGLLTGKFFSPDQVPEDLAFTRHFSNQRPKAQHTEEGCEAETFATIDRIREMSQEIGEPMAVVSLAWLRYQPGVTSVLAGARRPEHAQQNARAGQLKLAPEIVTELTRATESLKQKLGPDPDLWRSESRIK